MERFRLMPREFDRAARIERQIRRDLAGLLQWESADPRFASVDRIGRRGRAGSHLGAGTRTDVPGRGPRGDAARVAPRGPVSPHAARRPAPDPQRPRASFRARPVARDRRTHRAASRRSGAGGARMGRSRRGGRRRARSGASRQAAGTRLQPGAPDGQAPLRGAQGRPHREPRPRLASGLLPICLGEATKPLRLPAERRQALSGGHPARGADRDRRCGRGGGGPAPGSPSLGPGRSRRRSSAFGARSSRSPRCTPPSSTRDSGSTSSPTRASRWNASLARS